MIEPVPSQRQTLSYVRGLLQAHGIHPKNKLGQSFLIDLNLLEVILRSAELEAEDLVLEVGCGTGGLTARLSQAAGAVVGVEIDRDFYDLASAELAGRSNVVLLHFDVLKNKNTISPYLFEALAAARPRFHCSRLKMVANLPYAVATPVITNLLLSDVEFERMVVMVQAEIADRLLASPGTKAYGALAVLVQSLCDVHAERRRVPPTVFWPRPQVDSAIVQIRPNLSKRAHVGDVLRFRAFLRDLYTHRRKNLRGALAGLPRAQRDKAEVDRLLGDLGLNGTCRAEELDPEQHLRLCGLFG